MRILQQGTAAYVQVGPFISDSDGKSPVTTLVSGGQLTNSECLIAKNGAAFAQKASSETILADETADGWYRIHLNGTDTNGCGRLRLSIKCTGALSVWDEFQVVSTNVFNSLWAGIDVLDVDVRSTDIDAIADAVWDETRGDHTAAGSTGEALEDIAGDVVNLDGAAMRGTDSAASAAYVAIMNSTLQGYITALNDPTAADIVTALFAKTGITAGGTASFEDIVQLLLAAATWNFELDGTNLKLYDDDNATLLATIPLQAAGPRG